MKLSKFIYPDQINWIPKHFSAGLNPLNCNLIIVVLSQEFTDGVFGSRLKNHWCCCYCYSFLLHQSGIAWFKWVCSFICSLIASMYPWSCKYWFICIWLVRSSITDSGIRMICNVFPKTLCRLLLALCQNITSSKHEFVFWLPLCLVP